MVEEKVKKIMSYILMSVDDLLHNVCDEIPYNDIDNPESKFFTFTAFMEIWGDVTGQIYLSFSKEALEKISTKLFGVDLKEMGDDEFYYEGVKELINILTGTCKTDLKSTGFNFESSLPDQIDAEAANENLSFSNHETKVFTCDDLKLSINIAYY